VVIDGATNAINHQHISGQRTGDVDAVGDDIDRQAPGRAAASHGHPLVKETGAKYMRALGEYLRERLPRLELAKLA
jgi:hypothetical protein